MKNTNVSLKNEESILNFFNSCVRETEKQVVKSTASVVNSHSRILFNSTHSKTQLKNYEPGLKISQILRLKEHSFHVRAKCLLKQLASYQLTEDECQLVGSHTCEKNLENLVKVIVF